ncbi:MAG: 1,4-alpha-glucan branching protein GlgB [Anaerolineales bacterium]|nr:1,4-alpha-glucan branching protein GlgB [Anaerolineales bacterium]
MSYQPTLPDEAVAAIVHAYHGDPFSVLGPHPLDAGLVIRTVQPHAARVEVLLPDTTAVSLHRVHPDGLYEATLPNHTLPLDYELRITQPDGHAYTTADPYAFPALMSDFDEYLLAQGTHLHVYENLGAHLVTVNGRSGVRFAVWAPSALRVSVVGAFNGWDGRRHPMRFHHNSGIWELFVPGLAEGDLYKYEIKTRYMDYMVTKADPVGFFSELRPKNASVVWNIDKYTWQDADWMATRGQTHAADAPISVYEVHLGSWKRKLVDGQWQWLTYDELADELIPYVQQLGYTHVELLPVSEYPYDGSWGYQVTGYFAPTSRFGTPEQFMGFVDRCHQAGVGVILDWVPAHFPTDQHGLSFFDGTHLYEHADPRKGAHPDWGTLIFNYGRYEVRQFLISNAIFWLDKYHIDGLRVDAVASMLYLDFSREQGEWLPNQYGGRENLEAIAFIRLCNKRIHELFPDVLTIAEESTAWGGVTRPVSEGGLGFNLKWNMGWMHDTLRYMKNDPVYRAYHQGTLTFSLLYAFSEHFMLAFSHDEVVHLKRSMLDKMPGDLWQKFANLRLLYAYQWAHPGKKLLFMGGEFGQWQEWSEERSLDWHLPETGDDKHRGLQELMRTLNETYRREAALYENDLSWDGFSWIDFRDAQRSILAFARHASSSAESVIVVCNFTPVVRHGYRLGVPAPGTYVELLNTDERRYGGTGLVNRDPMPTQAIHWQDQDHAIELTLPPLGAVYLKLA